MLFGVGGTALEAGLCKPCEEILVNFSRKTARRGSVVGPSGYVEGYKMGQVTETVLWSS